MHKHLIETGALQGDLTLKLEPQTRYYINSELFANTVSITS